ncbi:Tyr recombinase domain-containing protein [Flavobacterium longum]|uniref:phage integrase SAM-like domain-containing protein n=1 Tax=Flavobacterium longum TaxID=1299340 RepID=UPI0039E99FDC
MATIKVVLRKKANKDGTFPLAIRITKDRKTSYIYLGHNLKADEWVENEQRVKSSHPNSKRLNNLILAKKASASDISIEAETLKDEISSRAIKQKIKPKGGATFFAQAQIYLQRLQDTGNFNCYNADKARVKYFKEFLDGSDVAFTDITYGVLEQFKVYLKSQRKLGERTIMNYLMVIRAIFNQAIKEGVLDQKYYPFGAEKISIKLPQSNKVGISASDVSKLEAVELANPKYDDVRNKWLISYYFAGMRISDVLRLRWSDFQNGRLHYTMEKNNKSGSLAVPEKALAILQKYEHLKTSPDDFVFANLKGMDLKNEFDVKRRIYLDVNFSDKLLTRYVSPLAKIEGKLSMHIARHTFATLAGDKVPVQMLQKLYRHSDVRTTIGYQANFIYKDADEALASVIGN